MVEQTGFEPATSGVSEFLAHYTRVVRLVGTAYCHNDPHFVILYSYINAFAKYAFQPGRAIERQIAKLIAKALAFRMEYLRFITH